AIRSAIAATAVKELVEKRGHRVGSLEVVPVVVEDALENVASTGELRKILEALGLKEELERVKETVKVRAGKGKRRGRRLKKRKGPLIVVSSEQAPLLKAARNLPGVDVCPVERLNAELLAPGTHPGRLTIWTESALKKLEELAA
ncbi:50S ribosomal protein L4, partial [Candidatus Bathyarchaeota archaeon]